MKTVCSWAILILIVANIGLSIEPWNPWWLEGHVLMMHEEDEWILSNASVGTKMKFPFYSNYVGHELNIECEFISNDPNPAVFNWKCGVFH